MNLTTLQIRTYGDQCLRRKSIPIKEIGPGERLILESMFKTMRQAKGIGLAAPQVGINQRFFVVDIGDGPMVLANPRITKKTGSGVLEEGCLSVPEAAVLVTRAKKITVQYMDEHNQMMEMTCDDLLARVVQHEMDHLDGKMIIDYAEKEQKAKFEEHLKHLKEEKA